MATTITAGNATNGAAVSSDNTGILELKTGTGSGTTGLTLDASQNATLAGTLSVGAVTSTGLVTGATGALYPIVSGTAITLTNQTAPDFTGIPSWVKRITVMLSGVSTNGSGQILIQLGDSGGYETSGYSGATGYNSSFVNYSSGFNFDTASSVAATTVRHGAMVLTLVGSNTWVVHGTGALSSAAGSFYFGGSKTLSNTLTSVRLYIDGTQQFDAGTINILWE